MKHRSQLVGLVLSQLVFSQFSLGQVSSDEASFGDTSVDAGCASVLLETLQPQALQTLAAEALERSPEIARARQQAAAAAVRAPQVRGLPDPVVGVQLYALPPETRVGPQRLTASIQQTVPGFGKLAAREQEVLYEAAATRAEVEVVRLDVLTEVRRLFYELAFLAAEESVVRSERGTLVRFEQAARARYTSGTGLLQEIVRIQAQITRTDTRLLELAEQRLHHVASLNALRDRPSSVRIDGLAIPEVPTVDLDRERLSQLADGARPELQAIDARLAARQASIEQAEKAFRPDMTFGLAYTIVDRRDDRAARLAPPSGNGDDILALTGSVRLPVRRGRLAAAVEEASAQRRTVEEDRRLLAAEIERSLGDLTARLPLLRQHLELLDTVLRVQAREALRSAETAYSTGKLNAIDLLDAEVVLLDVSVAAERTRRDLAVAVAELERAMATPLQRLSRDSEAAQETRPTTDLTVEDSDRRGAKP